MSKGHKEAFLYILIADFFCRVQEERRESAVDRYVYFTTMWSVFSFWILLPVPRHGLGGPRTIFTLKNY